MHYYQHNIKDYRADTAHLSLLEHGAYRQLLDWYYLDQTNIPKETEVVFRRLRAVTEEDRKAIVFVLSEFFCLTENGYKHARCDREIAAYSAKASRARDNGKSGGRPAKTKVVISGLQEETQKKANNKPITINQEEKNNPPTEDRHPSADQCPHAEILDLFAEQLPQLTQPLRSRWNGSRGADLLRTRWREDKRHQSLDFWRWFFGIVQGSKFHLGENDRGWKADLPWLLKRDNFDKILARGVQQ